MVLKYSDENSNGFSLVESLIALVIISLTIGSIFFALQSNIFQSQKIRMLITFFMKKSKCCFFVPSRLAVPSGAWSAGYATVREKLTFLQKIKSF